MRKTSSNTSKITQITSKVVSLLTPLNSEERQKVITASLTLLGEATTSEALSSSKAPDLTAKPTQSAGGFSPKAGPWMRQNGITVEQLEQVFHISDGVVEVIAPHLPGKNKKEKTLEAYVIQGISGLLASGEPNFDDKSARKACEDLGCYDKGNHAYYMAGRGNLFAGSKDKGWKLTAPGLRRGAEVIKGVTKES
jgi:hypothetical protein